MMLKQMALVLVVDETTGVDVFKTLEDTVSGKMELSYGGIVIDVAAHRAYLDGLELDLSATEFDLLKLLVERKGELVSFKEALELVWHDHFCISKKQVSNCVSRLNKRLGTRLIENVRGYGYRLV